jgi:NitT/TauT family transport system substrate-binding protein
MIKVSRWLGAALALLAATVARAEPIPIAIGNDAAFTPFFVAQQRGLFTKAGLDVKLTRYSQGGEALDAVIAGQAVLGGAADQTTIIRLARTENLRPLFIYEESGTYLKAVARPAITGPKDVKKLGIVKGTVSEYSAAKMLETFKIPRDGVQFVTSGAPEFPALLARGDIDAYFAWEPWPTIGVRSGGKLLMTSGEAGYAYTMWLTASAAWLEKNEKDARAIMAVLAEANRLVTADPEKAADDVQAVTKLAAKDTLPLIRDLTFKVRDFSAKDRESFGSIADFLVSQKVTPTKVDVDRFLQNGFYKE